MEEDLFLSEKHPVSNRWAILKDDGKAAWLFLTKPNATMPEADCWFYNRITAPPQGIHARGETPIVPSTHTQSVNPFQPPPAESVHFKWSSDGQSVAVHFGSELFGFIPNVGKGYSKLISCAGPYGNPIDMVLYSDVFGKET